MTLLVALQAWHCNCSNLVCLSFSNIVFWLPHGWHLTNSLMYFTKSDSTFLAWSLFLMAELHYNYWEKRTSRRFRWWQGIPQHTALRGRSSLRGDGLCATEHKSLQSSWWYFSWPVSRYLVAWWLSWTLMLAQGCSPVTVCECVAVTLHISFHYRLPASSPWLLQW